MRLLTPPTDYVDALSWSPDGREIAYSAAPRTGFTAAYDARIYAVALDGGARADDRRSRRHEHRPALFTRRPLDRVHLDQRPQRHHGVAQPDGRAGGRRDAARLRAGRCVGERVRVGARQPVDLPAGERRHVRPRPSTCSSSRSCGSTVADGRAERARVRSDRRVLDQPQRRRRAGSRSSRSARGRWATWR